MNFILNCNKPKNYSTASIPLETSFPVYFTLSTRVDVEPSENRSPDPPFLETRKTHRQVHFWRGVLLQTLRSLQRKYKVVNAAEVSFLR